MKKLLSLLSVLTISGTSVPTTIAASPYPNQEETNTIVKDNENNSQQIDNLNNNNWLDIISSLGEVGIKEIMKTNKYILEKTEKFKNCLKNLNINDFFIKKTIIGGEDKYEYRVAYHNFYLSHDTVSKISENIDVGGGVASIVSIISGAIVSGPPGIIIGTFGTLLVAQWKIWKAHTYDKGNGIIITAMGVLPTWIVKIEEQ